MFCLFSFCLCGMPVFVSSVWVLLVCFCSVFVPLHVFVLLVFVFCLRNVVDTLIVMCVVFFNLFVCVCPCCV